MKSFNKIFSIFSVSAIAFIIFPLFAGANTQSFVKPGQYYSWTAPGAGTLTVGLWGAGGGGGNGVKVSNHNKSGFGAGGGGYSSKTISINAGDIIQLIVGKGGNPGTGGGASEISLNNSFLFGAGGGGGGASYIYDQAGTNGTVGGGQGGGAAGMYNGLPGGAGGGGYGGDTNIVGGDAGNARAYNTDGTNPRGTNGGAGASPSSSQATCADGSSPDASSMCDSQPTAACAAGLTFVTVAGDSGCATTQPKCPDGSDPDTNGICSQMTCPDNSQPDASGKCGGTLAQCSDGSTPNTGGVCDAGTGGSTSYANAGGNGGFPGGGGGGSDTQPGGYGAGGEAIFNFTCANGQTVNASGTCGTATPVSGSLDSVDCSAFTGWAYDPNNSSNSIQIKLYADGTESSGKFLGSATANVASAQVDQVMGISGNHGFSFPTPTSLNDSSTHTIYAYGVGAGGDAELPNSGQKTISCPVKQGPPGAPFISGPITGLTNQTLLFDISSIDPNNQNVSYEIDWGDGSGFQNYDNQTYYPSGATTTITKSWSTVGPETFSVKAENTSGEWSDPSSHSVTISAGSAGPSLLFTANKTTVYSSDADKTATLSWSSSDTASCSASGAWSGDKAVSGTETVGPINSDSTFNLSCAGPDGDAPEQSVTISYQNSSSAGSCSDGSTPDASGNCSSSGTGSNNTSSSGSTGDGTAQGQGQFTLNANPASITLNVIGAIESGTSTETRISVNPVGFSDPVTLTASSADLPKETIYSFDGNSSITLSSASCSLGTCYYSPTTKQIGTIFTVYTAPISGNHTITITGSSGGVSAQTNITITPVIVNPNFQEK